MPALGLRGWVSNPPCGYLYFIFWILKDRFFRTRFLVISFPSSHPFHCSSSATSMPQMTLFFTFSCFFGKHVWVSMELVGCSGGREKEGHVIGIGFTDPDNGQRPCHLQKVMNSTPTRPWRMARREKVGGRQALESDSTSSEVTGMVSPTGSLWPCPLTPFLGHPTWPLHRVHLAVLAGQFCASAHPQMLPPPPLPPHPTLSVQMPPSWSYPRHFCRPQGCSTAPSSIPQPAGGAEEGADLLATSLPTTPWL